jgi:protein ImuB
MRRVACLWVPFFAAAAAERCEPALVERPLAVVRGTPPVTRIVEANAAARERGVVPDLTEAQARARCPALVSRPWSEAQVASAREALLHAALAVSPRVEDGGPGLVHVDLDGLERLFGDEPKVAARLVRQARAVGLPARVGIAGSRIAAWVAARGDGRVTIVPPGRERETLAVVPLGVLDLPEPLALTLERWGVRTLGELAALPRDGLALRLGPAGLRLHDLALGRDRDPFRPWTPPPFWEEAQALDWEADDLVALAAVLRAVLERLTARLAAAHVAADRLDVRLELASGARHERTVALAYPTRDAGLMLTLLRFDLEAHPPEAPVTAVALTAHPVRERVGQGGLWQPPQPVHRDLAAVLVRLAELVGPGDCGSPVLDDSHRPDAFTLVPFAPGALGGRARARHGAWGGEPSPRGQPSASEAGGPLAPGAPPPALVLRRVRPPRPVEVVTRGGRPARVRWGDRPSAVVACAGPWRTSGEWWDVRAWSRDEWDVQLDDGPLCRLALDHRTGRWLLDGVYD